MLKRFPSVMSGLAVALAIVLTGAAGAAAEVTLELKFPEDSKATVQADVTVDQTLTLAGQDVVTKSSTFYKSTSSTGKRAEDGTLTVVDKTDVFQTELNINGTKIQFDSANPDKKAELPQIEPLLDIYRAVCKFPVTKVFDAKNKLISTKLPEGEFEKLNELAKMQFDPETMKKATEQLFAFLPDESVKEGDTWERSTDTNLGSGQVMTFRTKYEYKGTVEQDGRTLDKIEGKAFEVGFAINGNPMIQLTKSDLKIKESASTVLFDRERGHVVSRASKVRIDGPLTLTINGMELPGKVDLTMEEKGTRQK